MYRAAVKFPVSCCEGQSIIIDDVRSMVIVGANGSGKSRLGHWIEYNQESGVFVHRVSAQRVVQMDSQIIPSRYDDAQEYFLYGSSSNSRKRKKDPKYGRWGEQPVTGMSWDFDSVLTLLYADEERRNGAYIKKVKSKKKVALPESCFDKLKLIWDDLFPHRKIDLDGNRFISSLNNGEIYSASDMSDGERVVFYLLGHCLLAPKNTVLVIDEPEMHIHHSLQVNLWDKIEAARDDCCFLYLTHDLDFAAYRKSSQKIWLKSYDGISWDWESVPDSDSLPEDIFLEILGSRKPILFVEGEKNSYDHKIYQSIYTDYLVIPRESCQKVIESTKSLRSMPSLHYMNIRGLIDRDYRTAHDLLMLAKSDIFVTDVAEIENLLCVEELIEYVSDVLGLPSKETIEQVKNYVISSFKGELDSQVSEKVSFDVKYQLGRFESTKNGLVEINNRLEVMFNDIDVEVLYKKYYDEFSAYIESQDYNGVLRVYNRKSLAKRISECMGLKKNDYPDFIFRHLYGKNRKHIVSILQKYAPVF